MTGISARAKARRPLLVLLLEDSEADADLIAEAVDGAGFRVTVRRADTKDEFVRGLRDFAPDVIISDHSLAQFNARSALKAVQAARSSAPVIVVSGVPDDQAIVACMRAGAEDFVLKDNLARIGASVEAALAGRRKLKKLSPRQYEVLCFVAQGLTSRAIAGRLKLSVKTVETHRGEIMKRLGIHDVVGLVRFCLRRGLVASEG